MKPFNLEEAKAGKTVITLHQEELKFLFHIPESHPDYRLLFISKSGAISSFTEDGKISDDNEKPYLFMKSEKKEGWVNVHRRGSYEYCTQIYKCEEHAKCDISSMADYKCTIKIEWYE